MISTSMCTPVINDEVSLKALSQFHFQLKPCTKQDFMQLKYYIYFKDHIISRTNVMLTENMVV